MNTQDLPFLVFYNFELLTSIRYIWINLPEKVIFTKAASNIAQVLLNIIEITVGVTLHIESSSYLR